MVFCFRARTRGLKLWKRRSGCRHGSRPVSRKANEFGFRARTRGRRPPSRPHSGPCSGICTRKNLHFYTQSCIIIPTPLKTPGRSGFAAIPVRKLLRIHIITVRKRPCGCVRSVFVFRGEESRRDGGESRRDHNRILEGSKQRDHNGISKGRRESRRVTTQNTTARGQSRSGLGKWVFEF